MAHASERMEHVHWGVKVIFLATDVRNVSTVDPVLRDHSIKTTQRELKKVERNAEYFP